MLNFSLCKYAFGNDVPDKRERPYKQQVATSTRSISAIVSGMLFSAMTLSKL